MVPSTKVNTSLVKSKEKDNSSGPTDLNTRENSKIITCNLRSSEYHPKILLIHNQLAMEKEPTPGLMEEPIEENGKIIKWMEEENSFGPVIIVP